MAQHIYHCSICGKEVDTTYYYKAGSRQLFQIMADENLCFDCAYWTRFLNSQRDPDECVIDGAVYFVDKLEEAKSAYSPIGTAVIRLKDLQPFWAINCRIKAKIPTKFKRRLRNEYKFITEQQLRAFLEYEGDGCERKGCWDRYNCLWYKLECEKDGPWNKLPSNYKKGIEQCPCFIDKKLTNGHNK